jgi:hypothetical protein
MRLSQTNILEHQPTNPKLTFTFLELAPLSKGGFLNPKEQILEQETLPKTPSYSFSYFI